MVPIDTAIQDADARRANKGWGDLPGQLVDITGNLLNADACSRNKVSKAKHGNDLSGTGAAIVGGRWNNKDFPAFYLGENPAICCLEHFVNASGPPSTAMVLAQIELPGDEGLYWEPDTLPTGWDSKPADTPSMEFGTAWLKSGSHLGLIVPSAVLPVQRNLVINPQHPAWADIKVIEVQDFFYDPWMFQNRP